MVWYPMNMRLTHQSYQVPRYGVGTLFSSGSELICRWLTNDWRGHGRHHASILPIEASWKGVPWALALLLFDLVLGSHLSIWPPRNVAPSACADTQREKRCQVRISLANHHCQGHAEIKTATRLLLLTVYRVHCRPDQHSYMPGTHPIPCIGYLGRPRPSKLVAEAATVFREWRHDNCEVLKAKGQSMGFHYCTRDSRMGLLCMWPGGVCHVTYTALVC
jgi:hypothetical protein